jgi:formylmethanofuran dehydrogenase subunit E
MTQHEEELVKNLAEAMRERDRLSAENVCLRKSSEAIADELNQTRQRAVSAEIKFQAYVRTQECAHCSQIKPTPYRRDDLGGYVCLTCVERYLDETLDELEKLQPQKDNE